jgi:hypothetical protein
VRKVTQLWESSPKQWVHGNGWWLTFEAIGPSGLRVASFLQALAATVTQIKEANKLTLGQDINVKVPHAVMALMNGQGHKWLTSSRIAHHQGLPCENPLVRLEII